MKFALVFAVFAVICSMAFTWPERFETLDSLENFNALESPESVGVGELVRHKRLSCLFEDQAVSHLACNASCISRKGRKDLDTHPHETLDEWFDQVNLQYGKLNRYSAYYMWELSTNPTAKVSDEASLFGGSRSRWIARRCREAEPMIPKMTKTEKRMVRIMCRGPKFTNYQGSQLSEILTRIQETYTETQVCLPTGYDVCINFNRIWDYTYTRKPTGEIVMMNLSGIVKDREEDHNPLHYFDGKLSHDYYVFRGVEDGFIEDEMITDSKIRTSNLRCIGIEPELEKLMSGNFDPLNRPDCALPADLIFRWAWEAWRLAVGPDIGKSYPSAVYLMNLGAQNNGYTNIGEAWREELEMKNLRQTVDKLWNQLKPYYQLLHAVFRNALWIKYENYNEVTRDGPIPAHLLGNMWSQDWSAYQKLLVPLSELNLDESLANTNWTSRDMAKRADDFFSSMGLNPMTDQFWSLSQFDKTSNATKCHGSAANMFNGDDYRMIVCAERTFDGLYTIIHEMGHLQYYMHYNKHQPALFQDAPNSAMSESIGDAIFLAMMTPSHLNRIGLLPDNYLFADAPKDFDNREMRLVHEPTSKSAFAHVLTKKDIFEETDDSNESESSDVNESNSKSLQESNENFYGNFGINSDDSINLSAGQKTDTKLINAFDLTLLLKIGLTKIPQIPFQYILDVFRWGLFDGSIPFRKANKQFWKLSIAEQGIRPPHWEDRSKLFDAAAKFHVADNTPYVRYFLASILQVQIFKGLCEMTVFGRLNTDQKLPLPLHRCDIYGSKRAGKVLKKALKLGASKHWSEVLFILTGQREVTIEPFVEFYQPLFHSIQQLIKNFEIPVGW